MRAGLPLLFGAGIPLGHPLQAAAQESVALEEIVVTAQKREEDIQTVPLSISVIGRDRLEAVGATKLQDYIAYVPGVIVDSGGAPGLATITIRGLNPAAAGTTLVATYIDDTPVGSSGAWAQESSYSLDLLPYDVDRIEILRGPQGTLYGANSMGGLLKYVTRAPQLNEFEARVGGDLFGIDSGRQAGWGGRLSVNAPLIEDKLAVRASGYKYKTPGYIDNPLLGKRAENSDDQDGGRVALLWQLTPALSIKGSAMVQRSNVDGLALADGPVGGSAPFGGLTYSHPVAEPLSRDLHYYSATVNWDLGWATAISASSYSQSEVQQLADVTATFGTLIPLFTGGAVPIGFSGFRKQLTIHRATEELRLVSPSGGRFEWLFGTYYSHENTDNHQNLSALGGDYQPVAGLDPFVSASIPAFYKEIAAFANTTFKFTDRFDVSAGLRWARNTQTFRQITAGSLLPTSSTPGDSQQNVVTYAVSPRYQLTDRTMLYLRAATGYRPGGPNVTLPGVPPQVDADRTRNYEAGIKATFPAAHAVVDAALFRTDWSNMQTLLTNPNGISYFANANTARSQGIELATSFSPLGGLRLGLNAAWLDAKLTADVVELGLLDGARMASAPKWTASATADYSSPLGAQWTANVGAGVRYVSRRLNGFGGTTPPPLEESAYSPVDLYARMTNASWNFNLYVRNAFNQRRYVSYGEIQDLLQQNPVVLRGAVLEPRTIGLGIDRTF